MRAIIDRAGLIDPIPDSLILCLHIPQHLLEVGEQVEDHARHECNLEELPRRRAVDEVLEDVKAVEEGAKVQHYRVKGTPMGSLGLHSCKNEDDRRQRKYQHD